MNKSWLVLPVALFAASCGVDETVTNTQADPIETTAPPQTTPDTTPDNQGGFGAPSQAAGEFDDAYSPYTLTGSLQLAENGCWYVELNGVERLLAFPEGFSFADSDSTTLIDSDGVEFRTGDVIDGVASFRFAGPDNSQSALPGGPSGKWANYLTFCDPMLLELVVFDTMTPSFDPTTLSEADMAELVGSAVFDQQWPCGRGWATSTADQRVGILIYQTDDQQPKSGEGFELPNAGWNAEVVVGKHLFVSHCNDAVEEWVPERIEVGSFPISGMVTVHDAVSSGEDPPAVVSATFESGSVTIGNEDVQLPTIELLNTGYNAFAG